MNTGNAECGRVRTQTETYKPDKRNVNTTENRHATIEHTTERESVGT